VYLKTLRVVWRERELLLLTTVEKSDNVESMNSIKILIGGCCASKGGCLSLAVAAVSLELQNNSARALDERMQRFQNTGQNTANQLEGSNHLNPQPPESMGAQ
jgi:hypothetical protein